jgi:glycosyltransferase involved in cell wall biosynthesis
LKVVIVASYAPSLINFRGHLLSRMVERGHEVIACAPEYDEMTVKRLTNIGVRFQVIPMKRTGVNPMEDVHLLVFLVRLLRQIRPDLTFAYTIKPVIYTSLAARLTGVPYRYSMVTGLGNAFALDSSRKRRLLSLALRRLYQLALNFNQNVFFQNPDDLRYFTQNGIVRESQTVLVNGSGIDLASFATSPAPVNPVTFLMITRLIREKGVFEYASAGRQTRNEFPTVRFRLVGPFDPNPSGISAAEIEQWNDTIEYLGKLDDVRAVIRDCSVYVLPSYYGEGIPRTILEAMSMGRAIITTDMPGCRETTIDGENGFLIPPKDPQALANAMRRFIEQPQLITAMGNISREMAEKKFDVHAVNRKMLDTMHL